MTPELLEVLACPLCRGALESRPEALRCAACARDYPIEDGIPNFVVHP